ncbi:MAG: M3 family metallopeptidase [Burkholderiales bacterium]|nr:M3 family metallopeptidase [Burkholderiales bacterium]
MNPLLDFSGLPRFDAVRPEHVTPAIEILLDENRRLVKTMEEGATPPTWDNFVRPLDDAGERLSRAWGQVSHLNAVMNNPALRETYNSNLPKVTQFSAEVSQNQRLFERYKALRASAEFGELTPAQQKVIENELRDFRLGGAELSEDNKQRFLEIQEELAKLTSRFQDNVLDSTNAFALYIDNAEELAGLPDDVLDGMREAAQKEGRPGWKVTLQMPSYMPVMQYADNRELREKLYHTYVTRASELGLSSDRSQSKPEWDNTQLIDELLELRGEEAALLDFNNFAELSLATKMAKSPQQVLDFLNELGVRAKPYAERDMKEIRDFARAELGLPDVEAFDIAYVSEKLRIARYAFSDQDVKQYFPETVVLPGMFKVVESIYGVRILPKDEVATWHPDVRFFEITDRNGRAIGQFYLDMYARDTKRGGAWMDDAINRRKKIGSVQLPVAYLTCNFSPPVGGKPALFTHDEVITLFHEFGHGLHHLLTRVEELGVSGINGVEWDAVELPSQFMENFCWEWDVLQNMTRHIDTSEPLPRSLYEKILAAKNFQSGMQTVRQLEFALSDMHLHYDFDATKETPLQLAERIRGEIAVVKPPPYNRFLNQFSHIFAGGYAAGYYSYKWAEVLSADAYSLFEENGVLSPVVGEQFLREVLAVGGSRPALESFIAFRGREPKIDALLKHNGMLEMA